MRSDRKDNRFLDRRAVLKAGAAILATPAIVCGATISVTIAPLCADAGVGELLAVAAEVAGGVLLHPDRTIALSSVSKRIVCSIFR